MAQKTAFHNERKPDYRSRFSWGLKVTDYSELFFVSGHGASDSNLQLHHPGAPVAQSRYIFESMGSFLAEAGYSRNDIVRVEITATKEVSHDDYLKMSEVMEEFFAEVQVKPSVGTFRVVERLVSPGMLCEYEFLLAR